MSRIGVFGGMGPSATVDFMDKLVQLTPASRDQEHIPVIVTSQPHIPDRSRAILGQGPDPLPRLLEGIRFLNEAGAGVIAIPCNSSHHWFEAMSRASRVPILHIGRACVAAIDPGVGQRATIFATRGALASGFYQRELQAHAIDFVLPDPDHGQLAVDACIRQIKAGDLAAGGASLGTALNMAREKSASVKPNLDHSSSSR